MQILTPDMQFLIDEVAMNVSDSSWQYKHNVSVFVGNHGIWKYKQNDKNVLDFIIRFFQVPYAKAAFFDLCNPFLSLCSCLFLPNNNGKTFFVQIIHVKWSYQSCKNLNNSGYTNNSYTGSSPTNWGILSGICDSFPT